MMTLAYLISGFEQPLTARRVVAGVLLLLLFVAGASPGFAGDVFVDKDLQFSYTAGEKPLFIITLRNPTDRTFMVEAIMPSCACLQVLNDRSINDEGLAPGAKTDLLIEFHEGTRLKATEWLRLTLRDRQSGLALEHQITLHLLRKPKEGLACELLQWNLAEGLLPRSVLVYASAPPVAESKDGSNFICEVKPFEGVAGCYVLTVTPKATVKQGMEAIALYRGEGDKRLRIGSVTLVQQ